MSGPLDRARIETVIHAMGERLDGDWLVVGGAAIALWLEPRRLTEDIDVVPMNPTGGERLALMQLAEDLGLPIEAVNSAADFFVRRVSGWASDVVLLHEGPSARVFRPGATSMLLLKLPRLSELDLADCERVLADCREVDAPRVLEALEALRRTDDDALRERRDRLRSALRAATGS